MRFLFEIFETIRSAFLSLLANKLRSFLAMLGVMVGISIVILMGWLLKGLDDAVNETFEIIGEDIIFIDRWDWTGKTKWRDTRNRKRVTLEHADYLREMSEFATHVIPNMNAWGSKIGYNGTEWDAFSTVGTTEDNAFTPVGELIEGRYFNAFENDYASNVVVLGYNAWKTIFEQKPATGKIVKINGRKFEVIGVVRKRGTFIFDYVDNQMFIPINTMTKQFNSRWKNVSIGVKAGTVQNLDRVRDEVTGLMRSIRNVRPGEENDFSINETKAFESLVEDIRKNVWLVGIGLTMLSFTVGIIGIMNIMFVSVSERIKEIGIRKALGAKRRDIALQFLIESSFLSFLGAILSIVFCSLIVVGLSLTIPKFIPEASFLKPFLPLEIFFIASGVSIFVGILAGLIPALRASRLDPVEALRSE